VAAEQEACPHEGDEIDRVEPIYIAVEPVDPEAVMDRSRARCDRDGDAGTRRALNAGRRQAMETKQYAAAEQHYRKALAETTVSAEVMTALGLSLQLQGQSAGAIHYYSVALRKKYVPETYALLAQEECSIGDLDRLRPMLNKIYRDERNSLPSSPQ
jgi:tetratricopeptide (TPR) repeat protein